jgi:hypothetical protein
MLADLIISSYNIMGCDAFNIGAYDLALGIEFLKKKEKIAKFPFLSANILDTHGKPIFTPSIIKKINGVKVGIFGICDDKLKLGKVPGPQKIKLANALAKAEEVALRLHKEGADYIILLTTLNTRSCRRLGQRDLPIDLIVGSSKRNRISLPILTGSTYIAHVERGGKSVGRLDVSFLGSAGVEALSPAVRYKGKLVGDNIFLLNHFLPLKLDIPDNPEIAPMVEKVETTLSRLRQVKATQSMSIASGTLKKQMVAGNRYVLAEACNECHPEQYQRWQKTDHAQAYNSLIKIDKHFELECIRCHTLGYNQPGGFTDIHQVGEFANVQCESCHGPGRLHVKSKGETKMNKDMVGGIMCLHCHIDERSPEFDLETYFPKVCGKAAGSKP